MNIVVLDGYTTNSGDLSWNKLKELGQLIVYDRTSTEEIIERDRDAEVIVVNAVELTADILKQLPKLKLISILATGYNNIDIPTAQVQGIAICNTPSYSTESQYHSIHLHFCWRL